MEPQKHDSRMKQYTQIRKVLWRVLFANLTVTFVKIGLGFVTGALSVVADGFHSLVDTSSNLIGLAAIRLASRPADEAHPYGYQRYETIGALGIGVMLLAAAWEISSSIVERVVEGSFPDLTLLTLGLFALTFPVNLAIFALERRAGRRLNSEILLADANHTKSDLFVTASVVASLVAIWLGVVWVDVVVAGVVVALILRAAFGILRDSAGWLTDAMAVDPDRVLAIAKKVPGVMVVHEIRSRGSPDAVFVDLHVKVYPGMSTEQAHAIASEVENLIKAELDSVIDALVHIEPAPADSASNWERIAYDLRQIADGMGLGLHDLHVHENESGRYIIELHLEMPGSISLQEAHDLAESFEQRVQERSTRPHTMITHLEPLPEKVLQPKPDIDPDLERKLREALAEHVGEENVLELHTRRIGKHVSVGIRVVLPPAWSLAEAHACAEGIERDLMVRFPDLDRVTVHMEPG